MTDARERNERAGHARAGAAHGQPTTSTRRRATWMRARGLEPGEGSPRIYPQSTRPMPCISTAPVGRSERSSSWSTFPLPCHPTDPTPTRFMRCERAGAPERLRGLSLPPHSTRGYTELTGVCS